MNFKVFLLIFSLPIFLSKYPPIFTDISDISVKFKYRYIHNYQNFVPWKSLKSLEVCVDLVKLDPQGLISLVKFSLLICLIISIHQNHISFFKSITLGID